MSAKPDVEMVAAQNLALTNLITRLIFPAFEALDAEGWKQMLDEEAERCERALSAAPVDPANAREAVFRGAARFELNLLRAAFEGR